MSLIAFIKLDSDEAFCFSNVLNSPLGLEKGTLFLLWTALCILLLDYHSHSDNAVCPNQLKIQPRAHWSNFRVRQ